MQQMEKVTDWALLWRQLVEASGWPRPCPAGSWEAADDPWRGRARDFASRVRRKWVRADPIREFIASRVGADETILDIGAGTGSWTVLLARRARKVTAVEPSPAMREMLSEQLAAEGIGNVEVVAGFWPDAEVEPHDVSLCAHSMYGSADLPAFVRRMVEVTRRTCYLLFRAPARDGVMAEAAARVWGQPHDSPNFTVGYGVLLQMGLCPNVLADPTPWRPWESPDLETALAELKRRLALADESPHDDYLRDLLRRRLKPQGERYVWPAGVSSALVYWDVGT